MDFGEWFLVLCPNLPTSLQWTSLAAGLAVMVVLMVVVVVVVVVVVAPIPWRNAMQGQHQEEQCSAVVRGDQKGPGPCRGKSPYPSRGAPSTIDDGYS